MNSTDRAFLNLLRERASHAETFLGEVRDHEDLSHEEDEAAYDAREAAGNLHLAIDKLLELTDPQTDED